MYSSKCVVQSRYQKKKKKKSVQLPPPLLHNAVSERFYELKVQRLESILEHLLM